MKHPFIFFGTPRFGNIVLRSLLQGDWVPSLLICNPDRPAGRKKTLTPPPTKITAQENSIPVFQPQTLKLEEVRTQAGDIDFGLIAAYGKIIPKEMLEIPRFGTIGVHPSLLPLYRGATPIQSAILDGQKKTGVTLFLADEKVDHGKIISASEIPVSPRDTYETLEEKLAREGARLVTATLPGYLEGSLVPQEQNHDQATFTKKISAEDAFIPPEDLQEALGGSREKTLRIDRMIRALNPEPGTWTTQEGKRMKILKASVSESGLVLETVQYEGKKPQDISS